MWRRYFFVKLDGRKKEDIKLRERDSNLVRQRLNEVKLTAVNSKANGQQQIVAVAASAAVVGEYRKRVSIVNCE